MVFEFKCAKRVRDALDCVFNRVRKVVHRIDAPLVARVRMRCVADAVDDRVAHIDVGRCHINLCSKHLFAVGKLAVLHTLEEVEVFFNTAVSKWAFLPRHAETSARAAYFISGEVANVRLAVLYELDGALVHLVKIVACIKHRIPFKSEPLDVGLDAFHIFDVFFDGVCVVKAEIAFAVVFIFHSEVDAQGLCVSDMQIAVRLRRKASDNLFHLARRQIFVDEFFNKVP